MSFSFAGASSAAKITNKVLSKFVSKVASILSLSSCSDNIFRGVAIIYVFTAKIEVTKKPFFPCAIDENGHVSG